MFVKAEFEDNFFVAQEWADKPHLVPYAYVGAQALRHILKNGVTQEYAHLNLPSFKRSEGSEIEKMLLAKENYFLVLPGQTVCVDPEKENLEWPQNFRDFQHSNQARSEASKTPPIARPVDQTSPLEPKTPSMFSFPEAQVISAEKKIRSPIDEDFEDRKEFMESFWAYDHSSPTPFLPGPLRMSPELYCVDCYRVADECSCPPRIPEE